MENIKRSTVALPAGASPETVAPAVITRRRVAWHTLLAAAVIALAVWLPRGFALDRFVTVDETRWLVRSANYYLALTSGNLADTYQHGHPGVIIMYAGMAGYFLQFPDYVRLVDSQQVWGNPFMDMLEGMGQNPMDILAAGRAFVVLFNVIALTLAFLYARRLVGLWPALIAFLLIALDPFHVALSRFLHPDSLLATFMLLATLAFMAYLFAGRRTGDLVAAGAYTAIAWLTKTPAIFLIPLVGLLTLIELGVHVTSHPGWRWNELFSRAALWRLLRTWLIWGSVAALVYVALWPAMWVAPGYTLGQVFSISGAYATEGHTSSVFFNGRIYNGDPGFWFYPINYLWRTTPVVMVGLLLLAGAFVWRSSFARRRVVLLTVVGFIASAFFFNLFMTLGAKKFDRYLLPVFPSLDFAAAVGWSAAIGALATWRTTWRAFPWGRYGAIALAVAAVGVQAALSLNTYPYYLSYYNPVMGGASKAEEVMLIGWGEGLDEAARYLNQAADPATTSVASWYERGPFSFFYEGTSSSNRYLWESDYAVVYNHQWQRELPNRRTMAYFDTLTPVHTVTIDGIDYVQIYDLQEVPLGDYTVSWGDAIDLMYYDTIPGNLYPGHLFEMTIYFNKSGPLDLDYKVKVQILDQAGHTFMLKEGKPLGLNTSQWTDGHILRDDTYQMEVPEGTPPGLYRIEISFYDPATFDHLPAVQVNNGRLLNDPYVLDYLVIGDWPPAPQVRIDPPVILGDLVRLEGAEMLDASGKEQALTGKSFAPGERIDLRLHWQTQNFIHNDYTTFVHVLGPDGAVITQSDQQPLNGFVPTSYWSQRQEMADDYAIQLPTDAPAGEYKVLVGWYDLETLTRLPISQKGEVIGDAYPIATFTVR
ncbi:MAG: glycosyltransferase family 39 protein [Caldilineaceae bacterium]|nr:glycosyltransferase family 39 protein [Caldilineaceae bacterium]